MSYEVLFEGAAERDLHKLPAEVRSRVLDGIDRLAEDPRAPSTKALREALSGLRRLRVGEGRVCYLVSDEPAELTIIEIGHRRDIYERLRRRGR